ncbi:hypothetical protein M8J75_006719 [Diaphorina citri]|nr:hypothetical protein M8J75_006719 [Diaphorina citri]
MRQIQEPQVSAAKRIILNNTNIIMLKVQLVNQRELIAWLAQVANRIVAVVKPRDEIAQGRGSSAQIGFVEKKVLPGTEPVE